MHNKLNKACRDMTQNLQNLVKAMHYGGDLSGLEQRDITAVPEGRAVARADRGCQEERHREGMDRDQLIKLIRTVKVNADLYDEIAKRVPSGITSTTGAGACHLVAHRGRAAWIAMTPISGL